LLFYCWHYISLISKSGLTTKLAISASVGFHIISHQYFLIILSIAVCLPVISIRVHQSFSAQSLSICNQFLATSA